MTDLRRKLAVTDHLADRNRCGGSPYRKLERRALETPRPREKRWLATQHGVQPTRQDAVVGYSSRAATPRRFPPTSPSDPHELGTIEIETDLANRRRERIEKPGSDHPHRIGEGRMRCMIEVRVSRLVLVDGQEEQFVQLTSLDGGKALSMLIGPHEAREIDRCLRKDEPPRPYTHALAAALVEELGGQLSQARVTDLKDGTYYAELEIESTGGSTTLDCRPSDAIALATRIGAPLFVAAALLGDPNTP